MPTFADLLSSKLNPPDPNDQLRDPMGQGQTLVGLGQVPGQGAAPPPQLGGMPQPVAPSPNVAGPLAALARMTLRAKPHIKLKSARMAGKPRIKLKLPGGLNASVL